MSGESVLERSLRAWMSTTKSGWIGARQFVESSDTLGVAGSRRPTRGSRSSPPEPPRGSSRFGCRLGSRSCCAVRGCWWTSSCRSQLRSSSTGWNHGSRQADSGRYSVGTSGDSCKPGGRSARRQRPRCVSMMFSAGSILNPIRSTNRSVSIGTSDLLRPGDTRRA